MCIGIDYSSGNALQSTTTIRTVDESNTTPAWLLHLQRERSADVKRSKGKSNLMRIITEITTHRVNLSSTAHGPICCVLALAAVAS